MSVDADVQVSVRLGEIDVLEYSVVAEVDLTNSTANAPVLVFVRDSVMLFDIIIVGCPVTDPAAEKSNSQLLFAGDCAQMTINCVRRESVKLQSYFRL